MFFFNLISTNWSLGKFLWSLFFWGVVVTWYHPWPTFRCFFWGGSATKCPQNASKQRVCGATWPMINITEIKGSTQDTWAQMSVLLIFFYISLWWHFWYVYACDFATFSFLGYIAVILLPFLFYIILLWFCYLFFSILYCCDFATFSFLGYYIAVILLPFLFYIILLWFCYLFFFRILYCCDFATFSFLYYIAVILLPFLF